MEAYCSPDITELAKAMVKIQAGYKGSAPYERLLVSKRAR